MKVYKVFNDNKNYKCLEAITEDEWDNLLKYEFNGYSIKDKWIPVAVGLEEDTKKDLMCSDMPNLGKGFLVANKDSLEKIQRLISSEIEVLPLASEKNEYYILNILQVIDCLDLDNSKIKKYKAVDEILEIQKYAFIESMLVGKIIFKIKGYETAEVFCTDIFKEYIEDEHITGLIFEEV